MAGTESPNTLISNTRLKIIDLVSEGETALFWPVSGVSGNNPLCSVFFDDVPVLNGDGSPNWNVSGQGFAFQYTSGASGQAPMVGFETVEAIIPLPFNTRVTNPPTNQGYPQSPVAVFNSTQYPDAQAVKVTTRFPAVYTVDLANGDTKGFDISWAVDVSTNNGAWVTTGTHNLTDFAVAPKCTNPYYNTQIYTLPKTTTSGSFYSWKVRVRRTSQTALATSTQNDMYVDSMAAMSAFTYNYPKSALVGLEITADQFGTVPTRAYEVKGIKVQVPVGYTPTQYNVSLGTITSAVYPSVWNGVFNTTRLWTDNPAWIFYDLVTNRRYGLGNYIRPEWIDKWTLYQIAKYCDEMVDDGNGGLEPRFTCNVAITQQQDAYTLLNNLVSVFQGMLYYANGTIFPVGPEIRDPVFNFSNSNVVNGAFSYSDTPRNTRSTVCVIKWVDPTNNYRATPERIEDINGIGKYGYIEKQITAFACTSRGQAIRGANWLLTVEQLLTETVSFQTDLEGLYLRPGDVFNVYDNFRNNQQQGGRIIDIAQTYVARDTIGLDRNVFLKPGFTYVMSALVPAANFATGQSITGSSQVGLIRNSQIETKTVVTPTSTVNSVVVSGSFSTSLYKGSVWILNGSGDAVTLFDQATQYKCLVTSEPRNGVTEILGVKYQTGINYLVNNNYSVDVSPAIIGDVVAPQPPTGMVATPISGVLNDNTFFRYLYLNWNPSPSINASNYAVFGSYNSGALFAIGRPTTTGINYTPDLFGYYDFQVAAFNANGYGSAYTHVIYNEPSTNPLGATAALSGIFISDDYDPYSTAPAPLSRYTGYLGTTPTFSWVIAPDGAGVETATAQFISGYRVRMNKLDNTVIGPTYILSGKDNTQLTLEDGILATGASIKSLRSFKVTVETVDDYGNTLTGATLSVTNFQPRAPVGSGFVGYNGGVSYNITPAREADVSGVYIWTNASSSFIPTFDNVTYRSTNLAAFAPGPSVGSVYTWYSLVDSYGPSGSILANGDYNTPIYGPISGNANAIVGDLFIDIDSQIAAANTQINNAFLLVTGQITNSILVTSGNANLAITTVQGLSGQVMGTTPGDANTALNVRMNNITVSSSGALSTQIDAVRANTEATGISLTATAASISTALTNSGIALAQLTNVTAASVSGGIGGLIYATGVVFQTSLATTGGALSSVDQSLQAAMSGVYSKIRIVAEAFVTGTADPSTNAAVARYGFKLDAAGKVVSMVATATSFPYETSTIVFGGADLQSDTFTAGSAGWRITAAGNAEFNTASVRGAFTGGAGSYISVMDGTTFSVGAPAGNRFSTLVVPGISDARTASIFNTANIAVASLGMTSDRGNLTLFNSAGTQKIFLNGFDGSSTFEGDSTLKGDVHVGTSSSTKYLYLDNNAAQIVVGSSNTVNLYRAFPDVWKTDDDFQVGQKLGVSGVSQFNGNMTIIGDCSSTTFTTTSARRFKENITPMSHALQTVHSLSGVRFDWKTREMRNDFGLIAEDVATVLPTAVTYDIDGQAKGVDYGRLTAVLIEAVKDLSHQVEDLKDSDKSQDKQNAIDI